MGDRDVLGLMLLTNAEAVAAVLRGTSGSESYSPLAALRATKTLSLVIEDTMRSLVSQARAAGSTWQDIGDVLSTSRQAAYQRFGATTKAEAEMTAPLADADVKARDVFERYTKQDWSFRDQFDANMSERLTAELLASGWSQVTSALGSCKQLGAPKVQVLQGHTVVDVPMTFENGEMKGRVVYDGNARIAGLFVLSPEVL